MGYCKGLEDRLKEVESHIGEVVAGREIINGWVNTVTYEDGTYRSRGMYVLKCKSCGRLKYLVSSELAAFKKPCRCAKRHFVPQTTDEELVKSYVGKMIAGTREIVDISKDGRGLYIAVCECHVCGKTSNVILRDAIRLNMEGPQCQHEFTWRGTENIKFQSDPRTSTLYAMWKRMNYIVRDPDRYRPGTYRFPGISVCDEWAMADDVTDFRPLINFIDWAYNNGFDPSKMVGYNRSCMQLRRYDATGPYSPENCYFYRINGQTY